jgi:hypothetical protein
MSILVIQKRDDGKCFRCTPLKRGAEPYKAKWKISCPRFLGGHLIEMCGYCRRSIRDMALDDFWGWSSPAEKKRSEEEIQQRLDEQEYTEEEM